MPDDDHRTFVHLSVPNAAAYRQVMGSFVRAKQRFTVHLRPEDITVELGGDLDLPTVTDALARLVEWGNLRADPDTSRVTTVEDFHRARFLYQLTPRGEATEAALARYDEVLGRRGALQAIALADIAGQLAALLELAREPESDPAKVHLLLRSLVDRFTDLAENAKAFMSSLQRTIDLHDADVEAFLAYKDRLIDYLERFVKDLVSTGSEISRLVGAVETAGLDRLLDAAAAREAEDAAPDESDDDPRQHAFRRRRQIWEDRWSGFRGWFVSNRDHPSQAKSLRARARAAVPALLQVVSTLNDRRTAHSDRSADFRELAAWFAETPDDAALHRLWRTAFGLSAARHLTVDAETLDDPARPGVSWAEAPPLRISPRLRRTGSYERRGKPNRVIDRSAGRRHLAELGRQEAAQAAAARAALATTHPIRLSDLGRLDENAFRLFLALLGDALAARVPGRRTVETTTSDGSLAIRLTALDDGRTAEIHTPHGSLHGPDHLLEVVDLTVPDQIEAAGRPA